MILLAHATDSVLFVAGVAPNGHNLCIPVCVVVENERSAPFTNRRGSKMESDAARRVWRESRAARVTSDGEILNIAAGELNACDVGWPSSWIYTYTT